MSCTECASPDAHEPEECPAAEWFGGVPTGGACEHALLNSADGLAVLALPAGSAEYYAALAEAVELMHAAGECPL